MFVTTKFEGGSMIKYSVASFIVKIAIFILFIVACIDNGAIILTHLQDFFNGDIKIDLFLILKEIGWMFLWLLIAIVVEIAAVFGVIFPMAKSEMNSNW